MTKLFLLTTWLVASTTLLLFGVSEGRVRGGHPHNRLRRLQGPESPPGSIAQSKKNSKATAKAKGGGSSTPVPTAGPTLAPTAGPTSTPSQNPTYEECVLGDTDYQFNGVPLQVSGDPSFKTVNGGKHDFQGQPLVVASTTNDDDGTTTISHVYNQFYYVTPCANVDRGSLPFRILGTHSKLDRGRVYTGLDYITIELIGDNGEALYYIFLNASFSPGYYGKVSDGIVSQFDMNDASKLTKLVDGTVVSLYENQVEGSGRRFDFVGNQNGQFKLVVDNDDDTINNDDDPLYIYYKGQENQQYSMHDYWGQSSNSPEPYRYRMHYTYIKMPVKYKCRVCGLGGDYRNSYKAGNGVTNMEGCDGSIVALRSGWNIASVPEAYDILGMSYEKSYWQNPNCDSTNYGTGTLILPSSNRRTERRDLSSSSSLLRVGTAKEEKDSMSHLHQTTATPQEVLLSSSSPCDESIAIQELVDKTCTIDKNSEKQSECCHSSIPDTCKSLEEDCKKDTCLLLRGLNDDQETIESTIKSTAQSLLVDTVDAICNNSIILEGLSHEAIQ